MWGLDDLEGIGSGEFGRFGVSRGFFKYTINGRFTIIRGGRPIELFNFFRVVHCWGGHRALLFIGAWGHFGGFNAPLKIGRYNQLIRGGALELRHGRANGNGSLLLSA